MNVSKTRSLVLMAMFAAIMCISAYISIPLPIPGSPHLTMQNFMLVLIALLFPMQQSFMIVLVWMMLGMLGVPVFIAGGAGLGYLLAPWGGYTVSFLVVAVVVPLFRGKQYHRIRYTVVAICGVVLIDVFGMLWLKAFGPEGYDSWKAVFLGGFVAFLPLDIAKAIVAAQVIPAFVKVMPSVNQA